MMTYTFKTIEEFVQYLDDHAAKARAKMKECSPRSHEYHHEWGIACSYEDIARVVRNSNIGIVC